MVGLVASAISRHTKSSESNDLPSFSIGASSRAQLIQVLGYKGQSSLAVLKPGLFLTLDGTICPIPRLGTSCLITLLYPDSASKVKIDLCSES